MTSSPPVTRLPRRLVAALLLALARTCAAAAPHDEACRELAQLAYPAPEQAPPAQCQSVRLYYGIGAPKDPAGARRCALAAGASDQPFQEHHGVLMMVYANGLGVPRDYQLARKAACAAEGAPAETEARLAHLQEMEEGRRGAHPAIDICDDITSGYMGGWCASLRADLDEQERGPAFARLVASWTPREKRALTRLEQQAARFFDERSGSEIDRSGTLREAFTIREQARQLAHFRAAIGAFERGALPRFTQAQFDRLDADMNAAYQALRRLPEQQYPIIRFEGVQQTQRAWLAYRDAWVDFGRVKYPSVPASAWQAWATQQRTAMLRKLVPLMQ